MEKENKSSVPTSSKLKTILRSEFFDYVMIGIGMIAYAMGWTIFLLPNEITTGGVAGISSLLFWGAEIPVNVSYFAINAVLKYARVSIFTVSKSRNFSGCSNAHTQ